MKKTPLLNAELSHSIATLGHTDSLCIADAGLPIPTGPKRIDLALKPGTPPFLDVLEVLLNELVIERVALATKIRKANPEILKAIQTMLNGTNNNTNSDNPIIPIEFITHETFKQRISRCKAIVRSGECSPYANIILFSGVTF